jgi:flagellar protein FliS
MSFTYQSAARAYANIGLETGVPTAEPHQLICMLYEGALVAIAQSKRHMQNKDIPAKGMAVSKAVQIIEEGLKASLDLRAGGDLARQLWQLYEYTSRRLLLSSLNNDTSGIDEVQRILADLKEAWESIDPKAPVAKGATVLPLHPAKGRP